MPVTNLCILCPIFYSYRKKMTSSRKHNLKVKKKNLIFVLYPLINPLIKRHIYKKYQHRLQWTCDQTAFPSTQSLMLSIAKGMLEKEAKQSVIDKEAYMAQNCPDLSLPHSVQELQVQYNTFTLSHSSQSKHIHTNHVYHIVLHKDIFLIHLIHCLVVLIIRLQRTNKSREP